MLSHALRRRLLIPDDGFETIHRGWDAWYAQDTAYLSIKDLCILQNQDHDFSIEPFPLPLSFIWSIKSLSTGSLGIFHPTRHSL